jgi:hypothetical protein
MRRRRRSQILWDISKQGDVMQKLIKDACDEIPTEANCAGASSPQQGWCASATTVPGACNQAREQLLDALAEAGVTPVEIPAGERFDSSEHRAVGQVGTSDPRRHNLVAKTERAGYLDRGRRLRYPDVVVFNAEGSSRP